MGMWEDERPKRIHEGRLTLEQNNILQNRKKEAAELGLGDIAEQIEAIRQKIMEKGETATYEGKMPELDALFEEIDQARQGGGKSLAIASGEAVVKLARKIFGGR